MTDRERLVQAARAYYDDALRKFGDDPRGVNWRDKEAQYLRFEILTGLGDLNGYRLHDVGCGLAHFRDFLAATAPGCVYVGSDISAQMIAAARARSDGSAQLYVADILASTEPWMGADYVVNSGVFTVRGSANPEEWWVFVQSYIRRMFDLARVGIAFNIMTSHVDYRDDHLFYMDPGEVLGFCAKALSRKVVIRHDYPLWEYMVYVYK